MNPRPNYCNLSLCYLVCWPFVFYNTTHHISSEGDRRRSNDCIGARERAHERAAAKRERSAMHEHALEKKKSPLLDHQLELSIPEEAMHEQALEKQKSPLLDHQLELSIPEEEVIVESEPSMALERGDRMGPVSDQKMDYYGLRQAHVWGCPTYTLNYHLRQNLGRRSTAATIYAHPLSHPPLHHGGYHAHSSSLTYQQTNERERDRITTKEQARIISLFFEPKDGSKPLKSIAAGDLKPGDAIKENGSKPLKSIAAGDLKPGDAIRFAAGDLIPSDAITIRIAVADYYGAKKDYLDELRNAHVWGCPTYTITNRLQNGQKIPKWEPRARRGIFLGISKQHSSNVPQVLHLSTGAIMPQYDYFQTVSSTEVDVPQSWENLFNYSSQRWFEEDDLDEDVAEKLDASLENRVSEDKKSSVKSQIGSKPTKSGISKSPVTGQQSRPISSGNTNNRQQSTNGTKKSSVTSQYGSEPTKSVEALTNVLNG